MGPACAQAIKAANGARARGEKPCFPGDPTRRLKEVPPAGATIAAMAVLDHNGAYREGMECGWTMKRP
jgi:hypothetical protein